MNSVGTETVIPNSSRVTSHLVRKSKPNEHQQSGSVVLPDARFTEGEPQTAPIRKLHVTEALARKYGPALGFEASPLCQPRKVQEKPEERITPSCRGHGTRTSVFVVVGSRTAATDGQASAWKSRRQRDGECHSESKRARTTGGKEVCVLDDIYDEWLDEPGQLLEDQEDSRNVPEYIQRMPFCPPAEEGLISFETGVRHEI